MFFAPEYPGCLFCVNKHESTHSNRGKATFKKTFKDDFPGTAVKSFGGVQSAGKGWAAVASVVVSHLHHQPAALGGGGTALVAKGKSVILQQVSPDDEDCVIKQLKNDR